MGLAKKCSRPATTTNFKIKFMILTHETKFHSFFFRFLPTVYFHFQPTKCESCCSENVIGLADGCCSIPVQSKKSMCRLRPNSLCQGQRWPRKIPQTTTTTQRNRRVGNQRLDISLKYRMDMGTSTMRRPSIATALAKWSSVRLLCHFGVHHWRYVIHFV